MGIRRFILEYMRFLVILNIYSVKKSISIHFYYVFQPEKLRKEIVEEFEMVIMPNTPQEYPTKSTKNNRTPLKVLSLAPLLRPIPQVSFFFLINLNGRRFVGGSVVGKYFILDATPTGHKSNTATHATRLLASF